MEKRYPKTCIVMPAYNEENRIGKTLGSYSEFFEEALKQGLEDYQILVVINNTKDRTEDVVKAWSKHNPRIQYLNIKEAGKGNAVIQGFKEALNSDFQLIGFVDADGATPPNAFFDLITNMKNADGTLASRYLPQSQLTPPITVRRAVIGKAFNIIVRSLFMMNYRDTQCGAKLFKRKVLEKVAQKVGMTHWAFDVELLYESNKAGFYIKDVPTTWYDIEGSKLAVVKTSMQMFFSVIQLRASKSRFKRLLKPLGPIATSLWKKLH